MDIKQRTKAIVAAAFLAVVLAPSAQAADDDVSRTFSYIGAPRMTHGGLRVGWFDSASPSNACLLSLFSLQVPIGGHNYYESLRVTNNANILPGTFGVPHFVPIPCPPFINPQCNVFTGCGLWVNPITVRGGALLYQDALLCTQSSFVDCMPTSATWLVSTCHWADASFTSRDPNDPMQANTGILGGTRLENVAFSRDIDCTSGSGYTPPSDRSQQIVTFGRNHVSSLHQFRVYAEGGEEVGFPEDYVNAQAGGSAPSLVTGGMGAFAVASEVVPGMGTRYLVSCLTVTRTMVDTGTIPPSISQGTEDSVDWVLVLDISDPLNWAGALIVHVAPGEDGQLVAGLYDQGGGNACDFAGGTPKNPDP